MIRQFAMPLLFASLAACGAGSPDPETDRGPEIAMGTGTLKMISGESISAPRFLPERSPFYPGATTVSKLVQRDAEGVIGRGAELQTTDSLDTVFDFYKKAAEASEPAPEKIHRSGNFALIVWPKGPRGYTSQVSISVQAGERQKRTSISIGVATDR